MEDKIRGGWGKNCKFGVVVREVVLNEKIFRRFFLVIDLSGIVFMCRYFVVCVGFVYEINLKD